MAEKNNSGEDFKISWGFYEELCKKLNQYIDYEPDAILCINSGGLLVGKLLSEYKHKPLLVISAKSYENRERKELVIGNISSL